MLARVTQSHAHGDTLIVSSTTERVDWAEKRYRPRRLLHLSNWLQFGCKRKGLFANKEAERCGWHHCAATSPGSHCKAARSFVRSRRQTTSGQLLSPNTITPWWVCDWKAMCWVKSKTTARFTLSFWMQSRLFDDGDWCDKVQLNRLELDTATMQKGNAVHVAHYSRTLPRLHAHDWCQAKEWTLSQFTAALVIFDLV